MDLSETWRRYLCDLGRAVRGRLVQEIRRASEADSESREQLAEEVAEEAGDVIFRIDRRAEETLLAAINDAPRRPASFRLIAEGVHGGELIVGRGSPEFAVICDPVDGSRGLMYDKRSAWFLAAVAMESVGARLEKTFAAAMIELPTSKQTWADEFSVSEGEVVAQRKHLDGQGSRPLFCRPSVAASLRGGFAHVVSFFPGSKILAAELMERISLETIGPIEAGRAHLFDDQYISSGGQMVELMMGRDRFCCDLRPLFDSLRRRESGQAAPGLACHPYDLCGRLVAERAGVILTDGFGNPLDAAMNVYDNVHWCGFANAALRDAILPVIRAWLAERDLRE